jgi:cytochrome oxidase assembly protein ShyY1
MPCADGRPCQRWQHRPRARNQRRGFNFGKKTLEAIMRPSAKTSGFLARGGAGSDVVMAKDLQRRKSEVPVPLLVPLCTGNRRVRLRGAAGLE